MSAIQTNAYEVARRYVGMVREIPGERDHPFIRWCHSLCEGGEAPDEVPWCSSFANAIAFGLGLQRSRSKAARSWLAVGDPVALEDAAQGDVVILQRGDGAQPGPGVIAAPGHVGFFDSWDGPSRVMLVGGNQGNSVSRASFPKSRILGIRRLLPVAP